MLEAQGGADWGELPIGMTGLSDYVEPRGRELVLINVQHVTGHLLATHLTLASS